MSRAPPRVAPRVSTSTGDPPTLNPNDPGLGARQRAETRRRGGTTLLVIGHDVDPATVLVQAGTLASWAEDRGVRLVPGVAGSPEGPGAGDVDAVAVLGSVQGAWDDSVPWLTEDLALVADADRCGTPVLGICFGGQLLARALGGRVRAGRVDGAVRGEHGWSMVETIGGAGFGPGPWMEFHFDTFTTPPGAERLAVSEVCDQAFRAGPHLGVQFHPEITPAVFETWARLWADTPLEDELPSLGVSTEGLRTSVAQRAEVSRRASWELFDGFAAQAGLSTRRLAG